MIDGQILIDGAWRESLGGGTIPAIDPSDGGRFGSLARGTTEDVDAAVGAARAALDGEWGRMPAFERGRVLARLGQLVLDNADALAALEARDVGKPLRQARADALALARHLEFYGGAADKVHGATIPYQAGYTVITLREPHGVTGHIVPWSDPMPILGRSVGAALAMGNAAVLKPGEDASTSALMVGKLALEAGLPAGVLNIVTGYGGEAGAALAAHPGVDHVSFTGSPEAGRLVHQAAATHGCPVSLELAGKAPQIVFGDADLEVALPLVVHAAIHNAGQTCSAGSRLLVEEGAYDVFVEAVAERFHTLDVGPAAADLDCGPLISQEQKVRVDGWLGQAHKDQLLILAEGKIAPDAPAEGFYAKPTLLGDVPEGHALAREEVLGPVLVAMRFADEAAAIRLANSAPCGPAAGIWTRRGDRQLRLARALKAGQVFVNSYGAGAGVELAFGAVKGSGFGRESGFETLYGFSGVKTVAIRHG
jgi:aldehyde dehydrogenase (NAD+)